MQPTLFGLDGIPAGDPGFTVAIEIDHPLTTLTPGRRSELLDALGPRMAHLDRSPLGNARIVFGIAHSGWWTSGQEAENIARMLGGAWPIIGVEICRSDLWAAEPFFDHEPEGLGELPEWCRQTEPEQQATVIVEVEPERTPSGRRRTVRPLLKSYYHRQDARLSRSTATRPQLIVEMQCDALHGAQLIAKPAHFISDAWSITRIRSVRADVYRAETSSASTRSTSSGSARVPDWQLVSGSESDRYVVVTDPSADMNGWSADVVTPEGQTLTRPFYLDTVWIDEDGTPNIDEDGSDLTAWVARIETRAHLVALHSSDSRVTVDAWAGMAAWLVESMNRQPVGLVIELGPRGYGPAEEEAGDDVVCAQIQVLEDGVFLVRRSRAVLSYLMLADYSVDGLQLDIWHHDDHFDDCTDGYLFTRDTHLIANTCTAWFRDNTGMTTPDELGCDYRYADVLPRFL